MSTLFHTWPHLIPKPPQCIEPEDSINTLISVLMPQLFSHKFLHMFGHAYGSQYEYTGSTGSQFLVTLQ